MATSRFSTFVAPPSPGGSRSVVMLSVVLGIVALAGAGWFAAQRYLLTPSVAVAAPTPPASHPAPKPKADSQKALAAAPTIPTPKAPAAAAPTAAASAARPNTERAISKQNAEPTIRASAPALPVPHEGFAIQVAAVRERDEADRMVARLVNEGYSGYLVRGQGAAADFYRVRVGAFKNRQEAEEVAAKLERSEGVKPWIVKEAP